MRMNPYIADWFDGQRALRDAVKMADMARCLDCMGSRKIHGKVGGKYRSCPTCLGLGKVKAVVEVCSYCLLRTRDGLGHDATCPTQVGIGSPGSIG